MRKIKTNRFGELEIDDSRVVHFKEGIPAFEDEHEFVILPYDEDSPYYFMQSLKSPELAFILTEPFCLIILLKLTTTPLKLLKLKIKRESNFIRS